MIEHGLIDACLSAATCLVLAETKNGHELADLLEQEVTQCGLAFYHWHPARGVTRNTGHRRLCAGLSDPTHFLLQADDIIVDAVFVFEAIGKELRSSTFASALHAFSATLAGSPTCVVCIDHDLSTLPKELERLACRYYPDQRWGTWGPHVNTWQELTKGQRVVTMTLPSSDRSLLRQSLTGIQTSGVFRADASQPGRWQDLSHALAPKVTSIEETNAIEFFRQEKFPPRPSGFETAEHLLTPCLATHSRGLQKLLIASDQGCGRSLIPFLIGRLLDRPVLRLHVTELREQYEEEALERLLPNLASLASSFEPLVLWLQDAQAWFSASAMLQTWLAAFDQHEATLVVTLDASSSTTWSENCVSLMDHQYVLTKPSNQQRQEIFAAHLKARGLPCEVEAVRHLASVSRGLTGADIETSIVCLLRDSLTRERGFSLSRLIVGCEALAAQVAACDQSSPAEQLSHQGWIALNRDEWDLSSMEMPLNTSSTPKASR